MRVFFLLLTFFLTALQALADEKPFMSFYNPPAAPIPLLEHHSYMSAAMKTKVGYNLYLPPGYAEPGNTNRYPVIYWLHGRGCSESNDQFPAQTIDSAIRTKTIPPVLFVYASGGGMSFYSDSADGKWLAETTIIKELIPYIDTNYRTISRRGGRAIQGMSMGGFGAMKLALKYPNLFSSVVAFAGGYRNIDGMTTNDISRQIYERVFGADPQRFLANHPATLARENAETLRGGLGIKMLIGLDDYLLEPNRSVHTTLLELNLAHEYDEIPGIQHDLPRLSAWLGAAGLKFAVSYFSPEPPRRSGNEVEVWLTNPDKSALFQKQSASLAFGSTRNDCPTIEIGESQSFQTIDGFGYTLTGGSALHLARMSAPARSAILRELFAIDGTNIGVSYLRVSIGASDLDEHVFSYDDLANGQTDPDLERFSLDPDRAYLIPALKEILTVNPDIKILGSPWSPPCWMKTNNDSRGGSLKPEYYAAYAKYFVKYIQGMKAEGIRIDAITVQNEPLHPGNNPSLLMLAPEQAAFVRDHLGPAFKAAGLSTKIILYDHNADRPDYPISILNDPAAKQYVNGSAFHLYKGTIEALTEVHQAHPDRNLYFTEQWVGAPGNLRANLAWHVKNLMIGASRNWCRTVLEWNLSSDPKYNPHTDRGGCDRCLGAITIDGDKVTRNPAYYIIAHASKFVRPGSVRIGSSSSDMLPNVAFKTLAGRKVLIVLNSSQSPQTFNIRYDGKLATATLVNGAVGTFIW